MSEQVGKDGFNHCEWEQSLIGGMTNAARGLLTILIALSVQALPARAQNVDIGGLLGGLVQGAIQADIQSRQLQNQRQFRQSHRTPVAQDSGEDEQVSEPEPPANIGNFVIDGHSLGDRLSPERLSPDYKCTTSDQFPGFQWCRSRKINRSVMTAVSVLLSPTNQVEYYNKYYESARFEPGAIQGELKRIASLHHEQPRIMRMQRNSEGNSAVIAVWGQMKLNPLDASTISLLATDQPVTAGILVDFLGDARGSAKQGLPVYRVSGGPGYYWAARFNERGEGNLRFGTADASSFESLSAPGVSNPAMAFSEVTPAVASLASPSPLTAVSPPDPAIAAQQQERDAQIKRDRADKVATNARQLIDDASSFVKSDPANPKALQIVQEIADLNSLLSDHDVDAIERQTLTLSSDLQKDARFAKYESQKAEEARRQNAQYLIDAIESAKKYRSFLISNVTQNPSAPTTANFLGLVKSIDSSLANPELSRVQKANTEADLAIRQAGLHNDLVLSQPQPAPVATAVARNALDTTRALKLSDPTSGGVSSSTPAMQLAATDKNRFLMEGDLQDTILMYNTSAQAPHVVKNLRGEVVFDRGRGDICLFQRDPDDELANVIKAALAPYKLQALIIAPNGCEADRLDSYDIIALKRGTFLKQEPQFALALTKALERDDFKSLVVITEAQIKAVAAADSVKAVEIENDVMKVAKDGFGVVLLQTKSPAICMITAGNEAGHRQLLLDRADKLAADMSAAPTLVGTYLDGAFLNIKRSQCGAVYASAADLKTLAEALKRDRVPYQFGTLWFAQSDVQTADDHAKAVKTAAEQQAAERQRKTEEQRQIASLRAADEASTKAKQQEAFRETNGAKATAAVASIAEEVRGFTENPSASSAVSTKFPDFVRWLQDKIASRWELMSENQETFDYGVSEWKGRKLDTAFAQIRFRLKNRMLGDYEDECFIFGQIDDAEFNVIREPVVADCENGAMLSSWKNNHAFSSKWTVE